MGCQSSKPNIQPQSQPLPQPLPRNKEKYDNMVIKLESKAKLEKLQKILSNYHKYKIDIEKEGKQHELAYYKIISNISTIDKQIYNLKKNILILENIEENEFKTKRHN